MALVVDRWGGLVAGFPEVRPGRADVYPNPDYDFSGGEFLDYRARV